VWLLFQRGLQPPPPSTVELDVKRRKPKEENKWHCSLVHLARGSSENDLERFQFQRNVNIKKSINEK
jgi:hypothetical protein